MFGRTDEPVRVKTNKRRVSDDKDRAREHDKRQTCLSRSDEDGPHHSKDASKYMTETTMTWTKKSHLVVVFLGRYFRSKALG